MTRELAPAPLARCLLVALTASVSTGGAATVLVPDLLAVLPSVTTAPFEELLVALCETTLLVAAGWLWAVTLVTAVDAARGRGGRRRGAPAVVRRALLVTCGAALATGLTTPSYAGGELPDRDRSGGHASLVEGLALPDRVTAAATVARLVQQAAPQPAPQPAPEPAPPAPERRTVVVSPGDTLWALAAATLPVGASNADVASAVQRMHAANRATLGADPDLIRPGQVLRLPTTGR